MKQLTKYNMFAIGFMLLLLILASGCVKVEKPTGQLQNYSNSQSSDNQPPTEINLEIGETAKTSKIEVTVISAEIGSELNYNSEYFGPSQKTAPAGKKFLLVKARIKNVNSDSIYVGSWEFSATDGEGNAYDTEINPSQDSMPSSRKLYKNQKIEGTILFELNANAKDVKVLFDFGNMFTGTSLASWEFPKEGKPEIRIDLDSENSIFENSEKIEIGYYVDGVTHDSQYDIHIYEKLLNEDAENMWPDSYDIGQKAGEKTGSFNYSLNFTPTPDNYPLGKYTLEITVIDNISDKTAKEEIEIEIT